MVRPEHRTSKDGAAVPGSPNRFHLLPDFELELAVAMDGFKIIAV